MTIFYTVLGDVTYHTTEHDHISRYRAPLPRRMALWHYARHSGVDNHRNPPPANDIYA